MITSTVLLLAGGSILLLPLLITAARLCRPADRIRPAHRRRGPAQASPTSFLSCDPS
ncbi:hypothetical protein KBY66_12875 [Synechococcus sp. Tobar12-5m-g]|uniref:hypothetical protein n=1 Tax=unclassified Synechococcus TaxID=2626047 RepID=UPI0020CF0CF1|nr:MULTISPECIES: hypothetical protein [unclassified Synechococcus]MCP9773497.1 hypothetical protein [Synechococcus sp. Tobar12-5m-g]MCP9874445.1 hypothetical protein [Synechococcus sp. Cruz CV-v-12]